MSAGWGGGASYLAPYTDLSVIPYVSEKDQQWSNAFLQMQYSYSF